MGEPRVGVGVIVIRGGKVLLGMRKNSHGAGTWSLPGGHLEWGESVEQCAAREVFEETGIRITRPKLGPYTNDIFRPEGRHYITLYAIATESEGTEQVREPGKCAGWAWFPWDKLPAPLFLPLKNLKKLGWFEKNIRHLQP